MIGIRITTKSGRILILPDISKWYVDIKRMDGEERPLVDAVYEYMLCSTTKDELYKIDKTEADKFETTVGRYFTYTK